MIIRGKEFRGSRAAFAIGDEVRVRIDEAGQPPEFPAIVVGAELRPDSGKVGYTVMDEHGLRWDGYSEDWLRHAPIGASHRTGQPKVLTAEPLGLLREIDAVLLLASEEYGNGRISEEAIRDLQQSIAACLRANDINPDTGTAMSKGEGIDVSHLICPVIGASPDCAAAIPLREGGARLPSFTGSCLAPSSKSKIFDMGLGPSVIRPEPLLVLSVDGRINAWFLGSAASVSRDMDLVAAPLADLAAASPAPEMLRGALNREWPEWSGGADPFPPSFPAERAGAPRVALPDSPPIHRK